MFLLTIVASIEAASQNQEDSIGSGPLRLKNHRCLRMTLECRLQTVQAQRCLTLQALPEVIRAHTNFHWWPQTA
jgi:hypothetical protein